MPEAARQATSVFENHTVLPGAVHSSRANEERPPGSKSPKLDPTMKMEPASGNPGRKGNGGQLPLPIKKMPTKAINVDQMTPDAWAESYESAWDRDPTLNPVVTETALLEEIPLAQRAVREVDDCHRDAAMPVQNLAVGLSEKIPRPCPNIVRNDAGLMTLFRVDSKLSEGASYDMASDN
eukprot:2448856-Rhodomonas_salina.3